MDQGAFRAGGLACVADRAAMKDQQVREVEPVFMESDAHQVLFNFDGIIIFCPAEAAREATNMGVDDEAFHNVEAVAQYDVGGFACNTG